MNKPPQIQLSPAAAAIADKPASRAPELSLQTDYPARNLNVSGNELKMEVLMAGRWQNVSLALDPPPKQAFSLSEATISLSPDGLTLNLTPASGKQLLKDGGQLLDMLRLVLAKPLKQPLTLSASRATGNQPALQLPELNARLPLNASLARMVPYQGKHQLLLQSDGPSVSARLLLDGKNELTSLPLKPARLAEWLATASAKPGAELTAKTLILKQAGQSIELPRATPDPLQQSARPAQLKLASTPEGLNIETRLPVAALMLAKGASRQLFNIASAAAARGDTAAPRTEKEPSAQAGIVSDTKVAGHKGESGWSALRQLAQSGLSRLLADGAKPEGKAIHADTSGQNTLKANALAPLVKAVQQIDITSQQAPSPQSQPMRHLAAGQPLSRLMSEVRLLLNPAEREKATSQQGDAKLPVPAGAKLPASAEIKLPGPLTFPLPRAALRQPLEVALTPPGPFRTPLPERQALSQLLGQLSTDSVSDSPDLNRLVNQAFSRMLDERTLSPALLQTSLLAAAAPARLSPPLYQASLPGTIDRLLVGLLSGSILSPATTAQTDAQASNAAPRLDTVLQLLLPQLKAGSAQTLSQQLQQLPQNQLQSLLSELNQVQHSLTPQSNAQSTQQTDSNPLVQFLLPMKLPPEAGQTEIRIGRYQKKNKVKGTDKTVWFVRLNFDYGLKGRLQVNAELMDKALDCQFLASSDELSRQTDGHLDALRHRLSAHGLAVGELSVAQHAEDSDAFYQGHTIINVRV